jgi:hypothetical protein
MLEWKNKLTKAEADFMQEILDQVPDLAKPAFESILNKLANTGAGSKFRYIIASMANGDVTGTNDQEKAREAAGSEDNFVVDVGANLWLTTDDEGDDSDIVEAK